MIKCQKTWDEYTGIGNRFEKFDSFIDGLSPRKDNCLALL